MRRAIRTPSLILLLALCAASAGATLQGIADRFGLSDYTGATEVLNSQEDGARPAEDLLWRSRLLSNPDQALELLSEALAAENLPTEIRIRVGLEIAELETARSRHEVALRVMRQLVNLDDTELPGAVYLQAGRSSRALGDLQGAREMLASIRPEDPAFLAARTLLGEIGLQQNDPALALRYFESAAARDPQTATPVLAAGMWEALRRTGEHEKADLLVLDLENRHAGSLALLRIRRILRVEQEELAARAVVHTTPADSVIERTVDRTGRFCLQLGAFSDRGLALDFLQRFQNQVDDLEIQQVRDSRGQYLYKIRSGSFVNPALANTEAQRLERLLGVEVIVADQSN